MMSTIDMGDGAAAKDKKIFFMDLRRRSTAKGLMQTQQNQLDKTSSFKKSFNLTNIETVSLNDENELDEVACSFKNGFGLFRKKNVTYTSEVLESQIHKLHRYCLTHLIDSYRLHINREKGIALIEEILLKANFLDFRMSQVVSLVWCTISCVHHFYLRLHTGTELKRSRKRDAQRALRSFENLLEFLLPEMFGTVIQSIFTFFIEANIWEWELLSIDMMKTFLYVSDETDCIIHSILGEYLFRNAAQIIETILCILKKVVKEPSQSQMNIYHRVVKLK